MKIQVSVVVPAYNREKTIERCIHSIRRQTMQPYEIILVDDGSTDKTVILAENMHCQYLKILRQNHKGAQAARNLGILNAKGNYIAFLDSDDEWLPEMLEKEIQYLLNTNGERAVYADGYNEKNGKRSLRKLQGYTGDLYNFLLLHEGPMFQSLLVKKEILIKVGLLDENVKAYQEWDTAIRIAKEVKYAHIHTPLFVYHLHDGDTISKDEDVCINGYAYIIRKFRKEILKRHGIKALNKQYKGILRRCLHDKNKLFFRAALEMCCVNMLFATSRNSYTGEKENE